MADPAQTRLGKLLTAANGGGATEVVMVTDQAPFAVVQGNQSVLDGPIASGELFEMLGEVLTDEQQVDLMVGNIVEFTLSIGGVGWHLLTEPGVDGVSIKGRVAGGMPSKVGAGRSVQLPAVDVESAKRFATGAIPAVDDELEISLEDPPAGSDPFADDLVLGGADPFDLGDAPPPIEPAEPVEEVDFAMPDLPPASSGSASIPVDDVDGADGDYDPFAGPSEDAFLDGGDPFGGLDAPQTGTRNVPAMDPSAQGEPEPDEVEGDEAELEEAVPDPGTARPEPIGLPGDDDLPPLMDDDDGAFTADFDFVDGTAPAPAPAPPSRDRSRASTAKTELKMPATRETEAISVEEPAPAATEVDAPSARKHPSSGATMRISAAEAANEMARHLASGSTTRETARSTAREKAGVWEEVERVDDLPSVAALVPEGSLVHVLGAGAMDIVGAADSLCFLEGDEPRSNADATEGREAGTWIVLSLDDPAPWLGWILRRCEEGHRVLVESRARTPEGAWRSTVGLDARPRAEAWIAAHTHLAVAAADDVWLVAQRR